MMWLFGLLKGANEMTSHLTYTPIGQVQLITRKILYKLNRDSVISSLLLFGIWETSLNKKNINYQMKINMGNCIFFFFQNKLEDEEHK